MTLISCTHRVPEGYYWFIRPEGGTPHYGVTDTMAEALRKINEHAGVS